MLLALQQKPRHVKNATSQSRRLWRAVLAAHRLSNAGVLVSSPRSHRVALPHRCCMVVIHSPDLIISVQLYLSVGDEGFVEAALLSPKDLYICRLL